MSSSSSCSTTPTTQRVHSSQTETPMRQCAVHVGRIYRSARPRITLKLNLLLQLGGAGHPFWASGVHGAARWITSVQAGDASHSGMDAFLYR